MGLTMDHRKAQDLLAAYALDAVDADEVATLDAHLAECPACAGTVALLRGTAAELAAITSHQPPDHLRDQTLAAAATRRSRPLIEPADAIEVHGIEADRLGQLLTTITDDQWTVSAGPAFPDWTVHDLTAHLAATETLLATQLGIGDLSPDTAAEAEARAHEAVARHRRLLPIAAVGEFNAASSAVSQAVTTSPAFDGAATITWVGVELPVDLALTHRAFEIWTHADDIRVALGVDRLPPPPSSLVTMSRTVVDGLPFMMLVAEAEHPGRVAELHLTGSGGGTFTIALGADGGVVPFVEAPDVRVEIDVVEFCRAIGDRVEPAGVTYRTTGDSRLGADLIRSLPVLAIL